MSPEAFANVLGYLQRDDTCAALLRYPSLQRVIVVQGSLDSQGLCLIRDAKRGSKVLYSFKFAPGMRYWIGEVGIMVGALNDLIG